MNCLRLPMAFFVMLAAMGNIEAVAQSEMAVYTATVQDEPRTATVDVIRIDDVAYVSLLRVIDQLGGGQTLLVSRMRVDFVNMTAWVQYDDTRVNAMSLFNLRWKVLKRDNDVLIARDDVPLLFESGFRTTVTVARPSNRPESITIGADGSREVVMPEDVEAESVETLTTSETAEPRIDRKIDVLVIDPGHGGYDSGVERPSGFQEKVVTLKIGLKLKSLIEARMGNRVILTRESDMDLGLRQRALLSVNSGGDFLVTLHVGASHAAQARGPAIYFTPPEPSRNAQVLSSRETAGHPAEAMATMIASRMAASNLAPLRGVYEAPLRIASLANTPGVLIEVGCATSDQDEAQLLSEEFADAIASQIAEGILSYMTTVDPTIAQ